MLWSAGTMILLWCRKLCAQMFRTIYLSQSLKRISLNFFRGLKKLLFLKAVHNSVLKKQSASKLWKNLSLSRTTEIAHSRTMWGTLEIIQERYQEKITLCEIAEEVNVTPAYLSYSFRKYTGQTIVEYINKLRIEVSKCLLINSDLQIKEVAERVGYEDAKYFSRVFHRIVGCSPTTYRKIQKNAIRCIMGNLFSERSFCFKKGRAFKIPDFCRFVFVALSDSCSRFFASRTVSKMVVEEAQQKVLWEARLYAEQLQRKVVRVASRLDTLVSSSSANTKDGETLTKALEELRSKNIGIVRAWIAYPDGTMFFSSNTVAEHIKNRPVWNDFLQGKRPESFSGFF